MLSVRKDLRKLGIVSVSALMLLGVGAGMSSVNTHVHAMSIAQIEKSADENERKIDDKLDGGPAGAKSYARSVNNYYIDSDLADGINPYDDAELHAGNEVPSHNEIAHEINNYQNGHAQGYKPSDYHVNGHNDISNAGINNNDNNVDSSSNSNAHKSVADTTNNDGLSDSENKDMSALNATIHKDINENTNGPSHTNTERKHAKQSHRRKTVKRTRNGRKRTIAKKYVRRTRRERKYATKKSNKPSIKLQKRINDLSKTQRSLKRRIRRATIRKYHGRRAKRNAKRYINHLNNQYKQNNRALHKLNHQLRR